jgi:flavodoxin
VNNKFIFYSSKGNTAKRVGIKVLTHLNLPLKKLVKVSNNFNMKKYMNFNHAIFICPTYGDGELEAGMEKFLTQNSFQSFPEITFSVIELGLYRGYDVSTMGSGQIVSRYLTQSGMKEFCPYLSLDSVKNDFTDVLENWLNKNYKHE